ncbi:hypothetical protein O77CONTIG1_03578 [Leptolyngbya sp. O-77]|nr:hypothetical protein O77CONTIG1_03578 [Leptolyngbya sp. O-77]
MGDRPKDPRIFGRENAGPVRSAPEQKRVFHRPKVILLQSGIPIGFTPESFWVRPLGPGSEDESTSTATHTRGEIAIL